MIDTVVLEVPYNKFKVIYPDRFTPNCEDLLDPRGYVGKSFAKAIQNPSKKDVEEKNYKPRLTLINRLRDRRRDIALRIEFSAPKMLFGNNFDELQNSDFTALSKVLAEKLFQMGITVYSSCMHTIPVTTVHFSKNVALTDHTSASMIIKQLSKVDLTRRLDMSKTKYRNEGHCLHYHANSFEIVFYDKIKDLQHAKISEKRAIEKENIYQSDIFELVEYIKPFEVVRMEARLCGRRKIRSVLKDLGAGGLLDFGSIFKIELSRKVLLHYWGIIDSRLSVFAMDSSKPVDLLEGIKKQNPDIKPQKMLQLIGAILLIQDVGVRAMRDSLGLLKDKRYVWYRLKNDLKAINNMTKGDNYRAVLQIQRALKEFVPLRLKDFDIN